LRRGLLRGGARKGDRVKVGVIGIVIGADVIGVVEIAVGGIGIGASGLRRCGMGGWMRCGRGLRRVVPGRRQVMMR